MSVDSRLAMTEQCDQCPAPPGTRCESAPGACPYRDPPVYHGDKPTPPEVSDDG